MALPTARDLINDAYDEIGVRGVGQTLDAAFALTGLRRLQRIVEQCAIDRLTIFTTEEHSVSLVANTQTYTIGTGGDFDVPRPIWIDHASIVQALTPVLEVPISIVTVDEWALVSLKTQTSTWPLFIYYDYAFTDPDGFGRIKTWPIYNGNPTGMSLKLYLPTPITSPVALGTPLAYPPGYYKFLLYTLALDLCPMNGITPSPITVRNQMVSEQRVKQANVRPTFAVVDPALTPQWKKSTYKYRSDTE